MSQHKTVIRINSSVTNIQGLKKAIIGAINTRANIIAFTETIKRYKLSYDNKSALYNKAIFVVTLDRLMQSTKELT